MTISRDYHPSTQPPSHTHGIVVLHGLEHEFTIAHLEKLVVLHSDTFWNLSIMSQDLVFDILVTI